MSYTVKLYIDSGYTAGNRPDSPARLEADSTVVTLSNKARVVQDYFLLQITLNLKNDSNIEVDPAHVDFMKVGSYYYKVTGADWKTPDKACTFYLSMEYLLSRGGIHKIKFISGVVRRYNPSSDDYGEYCIDDPYMAPSEPLELSFGTPSSTTGEDRTHFIQSTIELVTQGFLQCISVPVTNDKAATVDGNATDLDPIVFYQTVPTPFSTSFGVGSDTTKDIFVGGSCVYRIQGDPTVLINKAIYGGIDAARQLGAEGAILASYEIPTKFIQGTGSVTEKFFQLVMGGIDNPYYESIISGSSKVSMISNAKKTTVPNLYVMTTDGSSDIDVLDIPCAVVNADRYGGSDKNGTNPIGKLSSTGGLAQFSYVSRLAGVDGEVTDYSAPLYKYQTAYYTPANNKVYYGSYTPFVLSTLAGNQKQCNSESIYESGKTHPTVMEIADTRPDGTVYYYFKNYYQNRKNEFGRWGFMVPSLQWNNVPLTYTDVSGGKLKVQQFTQSRQSADLAYSQNTRGWLNSKIMNLGDKLGLGENAQDYGSILNTIGQVGSTASQLGLGLATTTSTTAIAGIGTGVGVAAGAGATAAIGATAGVAAGVIAVGAGIAAAGAYQYSKLNKTRETYLLERSQETATILSNTSVAVPTISFPQDMSIARSQYGEHPIVYRYQYSLNDLKRIDRILTMYGYRVCEPALVSMLTTREAFNYFEGDVQVTNADDTEVMPQWMADGIAEELSSGVRLWHQRPIKITADCNPVKSS